MNLMLRRREMIRKKESEKPNLATVVDFTVEIDSTPGRNKFPVGLQAKIKRGTKYHVSFDVDVFIKEVTSNSNFTQILSAWPNSFFDIGNWGHVTHGNGPGHKGTVHFDEITTAKLNDLDGKRPDILQYDSASVIGTYRAYNFKVTEV